MWSHCTNLLFTWNVVPSVWVLFLCCECSTWWVYMQILYHLTYTLWYIVFDKSYSSYLTEPKKIANAHSTRATLQEMMPYKVERDMGKEENKVIFLLSWLFSWFRGYKIYEWGLPPICNYSPLEKSSSTPSATCGSQHCSIPVWINSSQLINNEDNKHQINHWSSEISCMQTCIILENNFLTHNTNIMFYNVHLYKGQPVRAYFIWDWHIMNFSVSLIQINVCTPWYHETNSP